MYLKFTFEPLLSLGSSLYFSLKVHFLGHEDLMQRWFLAYSVRSVWGGGRVELPVVLVLIKQQLLCNTLVIIKYTFRDFQEQKKL